MKLVRWYNSVIGLMDLSTGLLLLLMPAQTLRLMGVQELPSELVWLQWIGVFVASVGFFYLRIAFYHKKQNAIEVLLTWKLTAIIRLAVAAFISVSLIQARLEGAWASVALTDGLLAIFQFSYLIPWLRSHHE